MDRSLFRLRVRYGKQGRLRYLGHLEVAHTIERSVRRAQLPYAVTQGFSPHMRIAFTAALPVGTSSVAEYYDLLLTAYVRASEALDALRRATPHDLAPTAAAYLDVQAPTLGLLITRQDYRVELDGVLDADRVARELAALAEAGSIPYLRGKKERTLDLGATLVSFAVHGRAGGCTLELATRASNAGSLRPEVLIAALDRRLAGDLSGAPVPSTGMLELAAIDRIRIERTAQFGEDDAGRRIEAL